jgi:hypothetical protein
MAWQNWMKDTTQGSGGNYSMGSSEPMVPQMDFASLLGYGNNSSLSNIGQAPMSTGSTSIMDSLSNFGKNNFGGFLDSTNMNTGMRTQGWGMPVIGAIGGLMNGFLGMKQYGLAKETLKQNKKEFELNFNAQKKTINSQMEDRQRARVASNPNAYQSVSDYMKDNGI